LAAAKGGGSRTTTLKIPTQLYKNLGRLIEGTGFRSVTEFAIHVLRDVAAGGKLSHDESGLTSHEVEIVRQRLRTLGYIE
jgi:hypothetical protein